ncbi:hypothetical protein ABKN59_003677 [Abortiporus biennis]
MECIPKMDSQTTLVDNAAIVAERTLETIFVFDNNSMLNNVLSFEGTDHAAYLIKSNYIGTKTEVRKLVPPGSEGGPITEQVLLARVYRNDFLPDRVEFKRSPPKSIQRKKWLRKRRFYDPYVQQSGEGLSYFVWRPVDWRQLELVTENTGQVLARFWSSIPAKEPAKLSVLPEAEIMIDIVLLSLLIVEQKYKVKEKFAMMASPRSASLPTIPS